MRHPAFLAAAGMAAAMLSLAGPASAGMAGGSHLLPPANFAAPVSVGRPVFMPTIELHNRLHRVKPPTGLLSYGGGPVLTVPHMYLILWDFGGLVRQGHSGDPDFIGKLMTAFAPVYGGTGYANIATQYYQIVGGTTTYISNPSSNASLWADNKDKIPSHPTDSQVQAEAWEGVQHFNGGTPDPNGAYIVVSSYHHDPQGFLSSGWCAYHGASSKNGNIISYTNMPYMPDGGSSCGANFVSAPSDELGVDEGFTIVLGHEYNESVTDPQPASGWYNNSYGEIGDECAWTNIQNDPFGSNSFTMQPEYSNASASCVHSY
jgi:serine protease